MKHLAIVDGEIVLARQERILTLNAKPGSRTIRVYDNVDVYFKAIYTKEEFLELLEELKTYVMENA